MSTGVHPRHAGWQYLAVSTARGLRATLTGIVVSVFLAAIKILGGILGHSYALIADGIESMLDILSSAVVYSTLRISATPPNERFPFGYGRVEPLGALGVSGALLVAAGGIAIQSVREIIRPHHPPAPFTLVILVLVVLVKEVMFRRLSSAGTEIGSRAVQSDAWHQRSDALTSLAAFVGIAIALVGGAGYEEADDWAALAACVIIATNGLRLLMAALRDMLDAAPSEAIERRIREVASATPDVRGIERCRVRRSGLGLFVDIHVMVDAEIPVRHGHDIGHAVQAALIHGGLGVVDVSIHVEPDSDAGASPPASSTSALSG